MKTIILAGGLGTRLQEETTVKPKPMVEVGEQPILWHIMKIYAAYGYQEFLIALGYKGFIIKDYFLGFYHRHSSLTVFLRDGHVDVCDGECEDWTVHLVDTGLQTQTGGRIKRLAPWIGDETFMMTYGDGVGNVDVKELVAFHRAQRRLATVTAVRPPARFGGLVFDGDLVAEFTEKPQIGEGWINGGFMVLEPEVLEYIAGDETNFEADVLPRLAAERQLAAFRHERFWQSMDTLRDVRFLDSLWQGGDPPWKVWE